MTALAYGGRFDRRSDAADSRARMLAAQKVYSVRHGHALRLGEIAGL
jgi:hypothetical protein